ncbi:MAG: hypothetical protein JWN44_7338 [Myxococcales bacterium]|jgi:hypothetical protein|nr:hypothetical protein [Myxococcales bacterium]
MTGACGLRFIGPAPVAIRGGLFAADAAPAPDADVTARMPTGHPENKQ